MTGTFAGALAARHISTSGGRLHAEVRGDVGVEEKVLVIRRIHIVYHLRAAAADRETIERVHAVHHSGCPVYRSLYRGIEITSEVHLESA